MAKSLNIAIIACEPSGDLLAANLINELNNNFQFKNSDNNIIFFGVTGPKMEQAGCQKIFSIEELSVMGIFEIIKYLPKLIKLRNNILEIILDRNPDLVIAVDAPDFNLGLEKKIKKANKNIKVIHYVSPSIWAWRKNRIKTIKKAVDRVLCLFPFEVDLYYQNKISANYVGHPLVEKYSFQDRNKKNIARANLKLNNNDIVIGLLPGSRRSEIEAIFPVMIDYIKQYNNNLKNFKFVIALSNNKYKHYIESSIDKLIKFLLDNNPKNNTDLINVDIYISDDSEEVMYASDLLLCASGTVTLEAALIGVPMIVMYYLSNITWLIAKLLVSSKFASLPNIILNKEAVPELLQKELTAYNINIYVDKILHNAQYRNDIINDLAKIKSSFDSSKKYLLSDSISEVIYS